MDKIEIYTMPTCAICKEVKEELIKQNIKFEEKIVSEFQDEFDQIALLTRVPSTPIICYKNSYLVAGRDFNSPENLITMLNKHKSCNFDLLYQNNEAIKTMNFNISVAFQRMDQILRQIETKLNTDEHKSTN